jgi:magnesium chelatase subunit D
MASPLRERTSTDVRAVGAATLLAVDPIGLGGALIRARSYEAAAGWVATLRALLPEDAPMRRVPVSIHDDRLLGGLDLAATLAVGRPVIERGVLAAANGGVIVLPMAERATGALVSKISAAIDSGRVDAGFNPDARDGVDTGHARFSLVAIDEGDEGEMVAEALADRVAFHLALSMVGGDAPITRADVASARERLRDVEPGADTVDAIVEVALAHGVDSTRAMIFTLRAARAAAALDGRARVDAADLEMACALVLGPRATIIPAPLPEAPPEPSPEPEAQSQEEPQAEQPAEQTPPPPDDESTANDDQETADSDVKELEEMVVQAMAAMLPAALLAKSERRDRRSAQSAGRAGEEKGNAARGRQVGARRGDPRTGQRLDLLETLRAAAPWQLIRRRLSPQMVSEKLRVMVRPDDFRVRRLIERAGTTAIFVVDASGSSALNRLSEAKGAVELLLGESYVRRDEVMLISFRGTTAEILLPPTRAIAAVKRALAALPGGGGTPLALAIDRAREAVVNVRREGHTPVVVFLTDARANGARDGTGGRPRAEAEAMDSARAFSTLGCSSIFLDTSPRPSPFAATLAGQMMCRYVPLPQSNARAISNVVRDAGVLRPARERGRE